MIASPFPLNVLWSPSAIDGASGSLASRAAWLAVVAMVIAVAGWQAIHEPTAKQRRGARRRASPRLVDLVLERDHDDAPPVIWLQLADGNVERLMRVRLTDHDVTIETDLTNPPTVQRFASPTPVEPLANRVLWAAAKDGPDSRSARSAAARLLGFVSSRENG